MIFKKYIKQTKNKQNVKKTKTKISDIESEQWIIL